MHVCVITTMFDAFKGGNHLPLFAALPDVTFTILTNAAKPRNPLLPPNIHILTLNRCIGPYYYGLGEYLFARAVLRIYPPSHSFWQQFDVIHCNQVLGVPFLRLREAKCPLLYVIHHPVSADRSLALEESSLGSSFHWRLKYAILLRSQRTLVRGMPHVTTVSHTAAKRIAADYGRDVVSIHIVPNGVDTRLFIPGDLASTAFDVIALGSFVHPRKGFRYLVQVYRALSSAGYRIADIGRRSAAQRAELARIPHVRMYGALPQEEMLSLLRRSSVLLSTSLYEGFGLSLIEAMACGRPAFAFSGGAVSEVLTPIDPELVVPLRNTEELVRRVQVFLRLPLEERMRKGQHYRQEVCRLYSMGHSAEALRELYATISRSPRILPP